MLTQQELLPAVPIQLRDPLLAEFNSLLQNYLESRWRPTELSAGLFCEIVYTILHGHAAGRFASKPSKPRDFVGACRALENNTNVPRSFQILIPRMLPALYEVRNNRGVGHVGGDVDPNFMDATVVVAIVKWVVAELVRIFHNVSIAEAQTVVDSLAEVTLPMVWSEGGMKRVLNPEIALKKQILMLVGSTPAKTKATDLERWIEPKSQGYLMRALRGLHSDRHVEFDETEGVVQLLPPGAKLVQEFARQQSR
ncbi:MAG: hypothetical protein M3032_06620 [Verrucomicrobiota bacterium]|nr:hypothetical protein [Verrucomicrobiota bacterium]